MQSNRIQSPATLADKRFLDRHEAAIFLTEQGFPVTRFQLQKLASRGGGPRYRHWGHRALSTPDELLSWAESRLGTPRTSTSEATDPAAAAE